MTTRTLTTSDAGLQHRWLLWRASKDAQGFDGGTRENAAYIAWISQNKTAYLAESGGSPQAPLDQNGFTLFLMGLVEPPFKAYTVHDEIVIEGPAEAIAALLGAK